MSKKTEYVLKYGGKGECGGWEIYEVEGGFNKREADKAIREAKEWVSNDIEVLICVCKYTHYDGIIGDRDTEDEDYWDRRE